MARTHALINYMRREWGRVPNEVSPPAYERLASDMLFEREEYWRYDPNTNSYAVPSHIRLEAASQEFNLSEGRPF